MAETRRMFNDIRDSQRHIINILNRQGKLIEEGQETLTSRTDILFKHLADLKRERLDDITPPTFTRNGLEKDRKE